MKVNMVILIKNIKQLAGKLFGTILIITLCALKTC